MGQIRLRKWSRVGQASGSDTLDTKAINRPNTHTRSCRQKADVSPTEPKKKREGNLKKGEEGEEQLTSNMNPIIVHISQPPAQTLPLAIIESASEVRWRSGCNVQV
ncbi:hypothetical protein KCU61_g711, partial [Aureobasidium melanogenum]